MLELGDTKCKYGPLNTLLIQPRSHNAGEICQRRFLSAHTTMKKFKHRSAMRTHGTDRRNKAVLPKFLQRRADGSLSYSNHDSIDVHCYMSSIDKPHQEVLL